MIPCPINLFNWAHENEEKLKPPVNNFCLQQGDDFFLMVVGGPNERSDFHINETEVFLIRTFEESELSRSGFIRSKALCF